MIKSTILPWHAAMHPQLTMSLAHLQQDGLLQHDRESLVLLVLLVIDDLHVQHLPASTRVRESGAARSHRHRRMSSFVRSSSLKTTKQNKTPTSLSISCWELLHKCDQKIDPRQQVGPLCFRTLLNKNSMSKR